MADFDKILPISSVKRDLLQHVKKAQTQGQSVAITKNGEAAAVLLSIDEYEGLLETLEILGDPNLMAFLKKSIKQQKKGQLVPHEDVWG
jgi:prevent-host-death family protein